MAPPLFLIITNNIEIVNKKSNKIEIFFEKPLDISILLDYYISVLQENWNLKREGDTMTIGEKIKVYLVEHNIKQLDVAQGTGMDKDKLCLSLNGKRKLDADEFGSIIAYLNVSADTFMSSKQPKQ